MRPRIEFWREGYPFWINFYDRQGIMSDSFTIEDAKILKAQLEVAIDFIQHEENKLREKELARIRENSGR